ncbi:MAG: dephospho-CoA kinase, partial [Bdellovibrionaceae bacterium]|nr:dephospho-CoA kinase [Pseudobdellovibrionaceae bacterium]
LVRLAFRSFLDEQIKQKVKRVFYEAPLISNSILKSCDKKILITCPISIRKRRLLLKGWTEKEIEDRLREQIPESDVKNQMDFIIDNKGDFESLEIQLNKILLSLKV